MKRDTVVFCLQQGSNPEPRDTKSGALTIRQPGIIDRISELIPK